MMRRLVCGLMVLIVLLLVGGAARAEDWPTWRHDPLRTGVSGELVKPPLERIWSFRSRSSSMAPNPPSPGGERYPWVTWYTATISAAGDSVFFNSAADGRTVCLDAATGRVRWEFYAGAAVSRVPTFYKGKVYVGSDNGYVYCLSAKTGKIAWKFNAGPAERWMVAYEKPVSVWPVRTGVLVDNGVAYFGSGVFPHDGTFMFGVDAESGKPIWRDGVQSETGGRSSMSPAGHILATRKMLCVPKDNWGYFLGWWTMVWYDRATGKPGLISPGPDEWPEWPNMLGLFWPVYGVRHDGVRYFGDRAVKLGKKDKKKHSPIWSKPGPGGMVDTSSVLSDRNRRPVFFKYDPDLSSVAYAGGILYHTAFSGGLKSTIVARDPKDGGVLWSSEMGERANQVIVANGRVFAATRQGTIYCFAPRGKAKVIGEIKEPVDADPFKGGKSFAKAADAIVTQSGVKAGYAVVVECEGGALALELAKRTKLYVVAVFSDADKADAARRAYGRAGLHVSRIIAYHRKPGTQIPLSSYFANLIVSEREAAGGAELKLTKNLKRILKPIRGVFLAGGKRRVRPRLKNAGGWFFNNGDAGNTNSSHDAALKPPLGMLWYGNPHVDYGGRTPGSYIMEGALLVPKGRTLFAYDQYTGRLMWTRPNTDMCGAPGSIFLRYLERIARVDSATGKDIKHYEAPPGGKWTRMAADRDGKTLFASDGGTIYAIDVATGKHRWVVKGQGTWTLIGDGYMYFKGDLTPELRKELIAETREYLGRTDKELLTRFNRTLGKRTFRAFKTVDTKTGKVLYTHGVDITNAGGTWLSGNQYGKGRNARHYNPPVRGMVMAYKDVIIYATESGADKGWRVWPAGQYNQRSISVHDGRTGKLLWSKPCNYRARPVVTGDTIYAEPWGYDVRTGKRKMRTHPITGEKVPMVWCRYNKQCGVSSGSEYFLFGRSLGVGYQDLLTDQGLYTFYHSRMSCTFDAVSGGGMMIKPPMATYCKCSWSLPFTIGLGQVPKPPTVGAVFAQPGMSLPVKHLYLDLGGTGDRRDSKGNLWLQPKRPQKHALLLGHSIKLTMYKGGGNVQRTSQYTPIENTNAPFVFATAVRGLKKCVVQLTKPDAPKRAYTVRLGFAALPGDKLRQRKFDVRINGKKVLTSFDIMKEAGKTDRAVWKEFNVTLGEHLTLEMFPTSAKRSVDRMPLINAIQVLRQ